MLPTNSHSSPISQILEFITEVHFLVFQLILKRKNAVRCNFFFLEVESLHLRELYMKIGWCRAQDFLTITNPSEKLVQTLL